jgi:hypothetical protein
MSLGNPNFLEKFMNLDECVLRALYLFEKAGLPDLDLGDYKRPLVVGSGNAAVTGRILLEGTDAVFSDESTYEKKLDACSDIDGAILISASGEKHAPIIASELKRRGLETRLLTCNPDASAIPIVGEANSFVFPRQCEPYTYNTSTYLGMILAKTKEDPALIRQFIKEGIEKKVPDNLAEYSGFYFLLPEKFDDLREMFLTKFDELFAPMVFGRAFTMEQSKHAKTVIKPDSEHRELIVSLGYSDEDWLSEKGKVPLQYNAEVLNLPPQLDASYGSAMAIGYYFIGKIQSQKPPYFRDCIQDFCERSSRSSGKVVRPIVSS